MMNYGWVTAGCSAPEVRHGNDGKESGMNKVMDGLWFAAMVPVVAVVWACLWVAWMMTPGADEL